MDLKSSWWSVPGSCLRLCYLNLATLCFLQLIHVSTKDPHMLRCSSAKPHSVWRATICTQWIDSKTVSSIYLFKKNISENKIWYKQQPEIAHETVSNSGPKRLQHIQKQTKHSNWAFLQSVGPPHLHRRSACRHLSTGLPSYSLHCTKMADQLIGIFNISLEDPLADWTSP